MKTVCVLYTVRYSEEIRVPDDWATDGMSDAERLEAVFEYTDLPAGYGELIDLTIKGVD